MNLVIINHDFLYEMENICRLFFPFEDIKRAGDKIPHNEEYVLTKVENNQIIVNYFDQQKLYVSTDVATGDTKEDERIMAVVIYKLLSSLKNVKPQWGILTGVRPIKLFRTLVDLYGFDGAVEYFKEKLLVTQEKTDITIQTYNVQKPFLKKDNSSNFSLYISIPYCPTRCSYCSFVSESVEKSSKTIEPYVENLIKEIKLTSEIVKEKNLTLDSVYFGGGTPTTLSAEQLKSVIQAIKESFDMSTCKEFTVEAGRPDTITKEKLDMMKEIGVERISINPQTFSDKVLQTIGRKHTVDQTLDAYQMAMESGMNNINMDLIAGLPEETFESFLHTMDMIKELSPTSVTVHTLSLKRSSNLNKSGKAEDILRAELTRKMVDYSTEFLQELGYKPYYLYRQSKMLANLENIGWCKEGFESIYNINIMEECQTNIGCGAAAVTKLYNPVTKRLQRIFNYKFPYEYNNQFDEMKKRKIEVKDYYEHSF